MSAAIVITDAQIVAAVGLGSFYSRAECLKIGRRVLALASGGAVAPQAPADRPALEKACDLLSMTIGTLMFSRSKIGYVDNSPIAKLVGEAVEFLRPWPEKMPEVAPAGASTTGLAERTPAGPRTLADADVQAILAAVEREGGEGGEGDDNAPGHCHDVPGFWDGTGKPCAWCGVWKQFTALITPEARAAEAQLESRDV